MQYTKAQRMAIEQDKGPFMALAAPGSGKTMVITHRTRYLIEKLGIAPEQILVITFTRAAANEMKGRFEELMGGNRTRVTFGTFHSLFFQILRQEYHYTAANIIREDTKYRYIRELVEREGLELADETDFIKELIGEISYVKGELLDINYYYSSNCSEEAFRRIYDGYQKRCRGGRLIDFDDMQGDCYTLLQKRPDILSQWQQRYAYILIDEFQDINRLQYEIIKMLAKPQDNLFIVGDDDQSIYRFRGARPELMLHFREDYPSSGQVVLDVNYRSSEDIVEAARQLISNNRKRYDKEIRASRGREEPVAILRFQTQKQEHLDIIKKIQELNAKGILYSEMAVLYRTNIQPRMLAERLMQYNIPFCMKDGNFNLYEHFVARNIISYIRLGLGDFSRSNFLSVMNRPNRYISRDLLDEPVVDMERLKQKVANRDWMVERLEHFSGQLSMLRNMAPYAAINFIRKGIGYDEYIHAYCEERHLNEEELFDILEELLEGAKEYASYEQWFVHIKEYGEKLKETKKQEKDKDAVVLSTMHASKGLEYEAVFIIDVCEGVTPYKKAVKEEELEEERRMFYVAMTRAKRYLYLYVVERIFNRTVKPSCYIGELEFDRRQLAPGVTVMHRKYGKGTIVYVDEKRMSIFFPKEEDTRTFHIDYAIGNGFISL